MAISKAFEARSKDVDAVIDTLLEAQRENGIETHMRKALFDSKTKERINKFRRARLEAKGVDLSEYGAGDRSKCANCEKHLSNIERGIFVYNDEDLIDDSDEPYVCEYCVKVGFDSKYKPEECDVCEDCESCRDRINGLCDGCEYSITFNGTTYGSLDDADVDVTIREEDQRVFDEIDGGPDYNVHYGSGHFTIMNF